MILSGDERFRADGVETSHRVLDFWRWAYSDLSSNVIRGVLAEYLVAMSLKMPLVVPRVSWDSVDLRPDGLPTVEVKAAAYVQSWEQREPSKIVFKYPKTRTWDESTGKYSSEKTRAAAVYVFCLFTPMRREDVDLLNIDLWQFFVVPTQALNERKRSQTEITLKSLMAMTSVVSFAELRSAIAAHST